MGGNLETQIKSAEDAAWKSRLIPASLAISGGSKEERTRAMKDSGMSSSSGHDKVAGGPG